ncbi:MAG: 30S ribosomal protein S4 [Chitinophagales bacterium]|jgi:small subunit ribosomal protein S4|nr:30S ribosomal protein S4 [Sphingobacteriales bacterium]
MARYRGPSTKIARKFGEEIFGYDKYFQRRKYAPGQHGQSRKRKTQSEYAIQLKEKQKAKYTYGLLERQFYKTFEKALSKHGVTGEVLLQLLEARLDNTVYRLGFAATRRQARQIVLHKHVTVNDKVVNIPSYSLRPGDVVCIREKSKSLDLVTSALANTERKFSWLDVNDNTKEGKFINYPTRDEIPEKINEQLIVELYSK